MIKTTCSLIVSTYNWTPALRLCLESIRRQRVMPHELIIADDGSTEDTRAVIEQYQNIFSIPVKHIWQPDEGYQLARIRNKAFAASSSDYIVQIDGDLILHPHFIADHLAFCAPGSFVSGARAMIPKELSAQLLQSQHLPASISRSQLQKKYNAVYSKTLAALNYLFQRGRKNYQYVLGCNMAFWRNDLLQVNGYNEAFAGWGKEDNDIAIRLINAGVQLRFIKFGAIVYHLFHKEAARSLFAANEELFQKSLINKITYVPKGMNQYISEPVN